MPCYIKKWRSVFIDNRKKTIFRKHKLRVSVSEIYLMICVLRAGDQFGLGLM